MTVPDSAKKRGQARRALPVSLWLVAVLCAWAAWAAAAPVRAEDKESPYQALVSEALEEFERGNWDEAYGLFVQAHGIRPNARTLRGMGFAALEARHYVRARRHLLDALSDTRSPLTKQQRGDVEKALATAHRYIARLRISGVEGEVSVDGRPAERDDEGAVLVDAGTHELVVETPDGRIRHTVDAYAGEQRELQLAAASGPAPEQVTAAPEPVTRPEAKPAAAAEAQNQARAGRGLALGGWVMAGTALLAVGGAAAFQTLAHNGEEQVRDACVPRSCSPDMVDREIEDAHIETYRGLAIAGWSLAGAAALTAGTLFVLAFRKQRGTADLSVSLRGRGLQLSGRF